MNARAFKALWGGAVALMLVAGGLSAAEPEAKKAVKLPKPPARTQPLLDKGKQAFTLYCVACHGEKGDGQGPAGMALKPPPRNFAKDAFKQGQSTAEIFLTVSNGVPQTAMVGYGHLPEEDRWGLAYYVGEFIPKKKAAKK